MTVQVDSQPVTDQNMWCIDICCINNSISCLEKKTMFGTHEQTCYVNINVGLLPPPTILVSLKFTSPELMGRHLVALVLLTTIHMNTKVENINSIFFLPSVQPSGGVGGGGWGGVFDYLNTRAGGLQFHQS